LNKIFLCDNCALLFHAVISAKRISNQLENRVIEKKESLEKNIQRNRKTNIKWTIEEKEATMKKDLNEEKER
jgi:hypothetical protein